VDVQVFHVRVQQHLLDGVLKGAATLIGTYFGARMLKERVTPVRLIGAALIVSGVIALATDDDFSHEITQGSIETRPA
jgi:drug/metabolite transporter (DMT)-like permease